MEVMIDEPPAGPCDSHSAIIGAMVARDVLVVARRRTGLSQRQLAERLGRPQSTIGRWETGVRSPSFADVVDALAACSLELAPDLLTRDLSLVGGARDRLGLEPMERLAGLRGLGEVSDVLERVARAGLHCVVVGQVAGALQGWPLRLPSAVLELVVDDRDQERLAEMLAAAGAQSGSAADRRSRWQAEDVTCWQLLGGGAVEVLHRPAGTRGYRDLAGDANEVLIAGVQLSVASVLDLIRMADASQATGGRFFVPALYAVLDARRLGPNRVLAYDSREGQEALQAWLTAQAN